MKKLIALIISLATLFSLVSCFEGINKESDHLNIGFMSGPTGMGMAKLIHDNGGLEGNDKYSFEGFTDSKLAVAALVSGKLDVICLPTNEAATLYNANGKIQVLAINCLNSLYLLSNSQYSDGEINDFYDLDGKTIYTCKNGTPKIILDYLIEATGINATVLTSYDGKEILSPADLGARVVVGGPELVVAPEPIVTSSLLKNSDYKVELDLDDAWSSVNDTPVTMGCIVARAEFVKSNSNLINEFLGEYKASIEFIGTKANIDDAAAYVTEAGVMGAVGAAKKSLLNLGDAISYLDGAEMKKALKVFYAAFGMDQPKDTFYYEK